MNEARIKIVICDDDATQADAWRQACSAALDYLEIEQEIHLVADGVGLQDYVSRLDDRRKSLRNEPADIRDRTQWNEPPFDAADVVVLDYELLGQPTGHEIAYRARCFSACGSILVLNEADFENQFDLRMNEDVRHFADVLIGGEQLANPGLWDGTSRGFRPWLWPAVAGESARIKERASALQSGGQRPLLEVLALSHIADYLSEDARAAITPAKEGRDAFKFATIRQVLDESPLGPARQDRLRGDELWRVGAARIARWLRTVVLPTQDALVDAPHLTASERIAPDDQFELVHLDDDLGLERAAGVRPWSQASLWLGRPAWVYPDVAARRSERWHAEPASDEERAVFCEDLSAFVPAGAAREFVPDVATSTPYRYVLDPTSVAGKALCGQFKREFADGSASQDAVDPCQVTYEPSLKFAL